MKLRHWLARGIAAATLGLAGSLAADEGPRPVVKIGSKVFTENVILGEIVTLLARDGGADAIHKNDLGGTPIVFKSLESGAIDVYAEYTGTLAGDILAGQSVRNEAQLRAALAERGIRMSKRLGFNNKYALGLKESLAKELGLTNISQLAEHPQLRLGFSEEFMNRSDGWPGLVRHYGLPHKPRVVDHNLAYHGLEQEALDLTDLFSTDAEVRYYELRLLDDDRGYFPQYYCVLLYREDLAKRAPRVVESILRLEGRIDNARMVEMNSQVKLDRRRESEVAADFLRGELGLAIDLPPHGMWRDLWKTTRAHLYLVALSLSAAVIAGIPLGIWSYKWPPLGHVILGAISILQTLPSMAVLVFMIPLFGLGPRPAIVALFIYSLLPIVRGTYAGLKEVAGNLKESAIVLGLSPQARLYLVELPIASRSILSGIKTSAVINVGTATIGALIGAGGYGEPIMQ
ncbi:MAG: glycine betaine ABC transporter substrate-binding protein [Pirellulaceae bacterium]|nr:glycine betaine ABC transporter substrate-binding protein [Pirellulaceae bacterium]